MPGRRTIFLFLLILLGAVVFGRTAGAVEVGRYKTLELVFTASTQPANPFDTYLLKLEVTDPAGKSFIIDGFFDGDGNGGQSGSIWKARICPYSTGTWSWKTVTGDAPDSGLAGHSGQFECVESSDRGGVELSGRHIRFQTGGYVYLLGNFLDLAGGLRTTHTFMSETTTDAQRDAIIARQRDFHAANKANIYFANVGDYSSQSVTPWMGTAGNPDRTKMNLARWKLYDSYIRRFKDAGMLAELWFFADDSNFGPLSQTDKNRLFRYAMARTSAFSHTLYVIALEWQEGWSQKSVNDSGNFIQNHNPWKRLLSTHTLDTSWAFGDQSWPSFIASQPGNSAGSTQVNQAVIAIRNTYSIPHVAEEFGILDSNVVTRLRSNLWAAFCGGAAGSGTGSDLKAFQRFMSQARVPFQRMSPDNGLVQGGGSTRFCLAERGNHYVVYSTGGAFTLSVTGNGLQGRWFNPRDPNGSLGNPFPVQAGTQSFTPPSDTASDWVLWVSNGSQLGNTAVNPSTGATVVQVIVTGSKENSRPTVAITAPKGASTFVRGDIIPIVASAADADGSVTKVEFFDGATKLGEDLTAPYQFNWNSTSAAAGSHSLTARATDDKGESTLSSPVSISILSGTNAPPVITEFRASPAMQVRGQTVNYHLSATDPDNGTLSFSIDIDGDGNPETSGTLVSGNSTTYSYSFSSVGKLTSRATVRDSSQSTQAQAAVTIVELPHAADPRPSTAAGPAPLTVTFSGAVSGGIPPYTFQWDFGDGAINPGPGNDVQHTYTEPGTYTVRMTVIDSGGNRVTGDSQIRVQTADQSTGLLAHWKFDENGGSVATDASGYGYTGNINGAAWSKGRLGSALSFDGTDDRVELPAALLGRLSGFTFSAWIRTPTSRRGDIYAERVGESSTNLDININEDPGRVKVVWRPSGSQIYSLVTPLSVNNDNWQHIAAVRNQNTLSLYLNGKLVASRNDITGTIDADQARIGQMFTAFEGLIDDVRLYGRPLGEAEISSLAQEGLQPPTGLRVVR